MLSTLRNYLTLSRQALPVLLVPYASAFAYEMARKFVVSVPLGNVRQIGVSLFFAFAAFGLLLALAIYLYRAGRDLLPFRSLEQKHDVEHFRVLVLPLSAPNLGLSVASDGAITILDRSDGRVRVTLAGQSLAADIEQLNQPGADGAPPIRWNWQQLLRTLSRNPSVEKLFLLGSTGPGGSRGQIDNARALISRYRPDVKVETHAVDVNFESIDDLCAAFVAIIHQSLGEGYGTSDIVIDVTGGQKTTSIAGALITLNENVSFQYIQSKGRYRALSFNVKLQPRLTSL